MLSFMVAWMVCWIYELRSLELGVASILKQLHEVCGVVLRFANPQLIIRYYQNHTHPIVCPRIAAI